MAVAGVYDHQDGCNLESALFKNSWKIRVKKLLKGSEKPSILHIQRLLKEVNELLGIILLIFKSFYYLSVYFLGITSPCGENAFLIYLVYVPNDLFAKRNFIAVASCSLRPMEENLT